MGDELGGAVEVGLKVAVGSDVGGGVVGRCTGASVEPIGAMDASSVVVVEELGGLEESSKKTK